jgi:carboxylesterase
MEPLAEVLAGAGHEVRNPLLPGHGTSVADWNATTFEQWADFAQARFEELEREVDCAVVVGMSMGGSLGLRIAERCSPAGLMTLAAPVFVYTLLPPRMKDWRLPLVPLLRRVRPIWPVRPRPAEHEAVAPWRGYDGAVGLDALHSFLCGLKAVRRDLGRVRCPILAVHADNDRTTSPENAWEILRRVSSEHRRMALVHIRETVTGHHMLTTHRETRELVHNLAVEFVDEVLRTRGQGGPATP